MVLQSRNAILVGTISSEEEGARAEGSKARGGEEEANDDSARSRLAADSSLKCVGHASEDEGEEEDEVKWKTKDDV